ncbi:MAG: hypothetical protein WB762_09690 [Candidatus Sulfotelmatobacter sp.]
MSPAYGYAINGDVRSGKPVVSNRRRRHSAESVHRKAYFSQVRNIPHAPIDDSSREISRACIAVPIRPPMPAISAPSSTITYTEFGPS